MNLNEGKTVQIRRRPDRSSRPNGCERLYCKLLMTAGVCTANGCDRMKEQQVVFKQARTPAPSQCRNRDAGPTGGVL